MEPQEDPPQPPPLGPEPLAAVSAPVVQSTTHKAHVSEALSPPRVSWVRWWWHWFKARYWHSWRFDREPSLFDGLEVLVAAVAVAAVVWQIRQTNVAIGIAMNGTAEAKRAADEAKVANDLAWTTRAEDKLKATAEGDRAERMVKAAEQNAIAARIGAEAAASAVAAQREALTFNARAWVGIDVAYLTPVPLVSPARAFVGFANQGQTPALEVTEIEVNSGFSGPCQQHTHQLPSPAYAAITVSAALGQGAKGGVREHEVTLSQAELRRLSTNASPLYFYGGLRYRDVFGQSHETRYCFVYEGNMTPDKEKPDRIALGWCGCHNTMN